jgi:adenylate kinase family enzyme
VIGARRLPDRIWIVGPTGAGKSTLSRLLAERAGVEPVHLDDIYHQPGWTTLSPEDLHLRVEAITAGPRWIVDGNYGALRRLHMHKAELLIWLDLPLRVTLPRLLRRSLRRIIRREPCCNGNYETWRHTFFSGESILWWAIKTDGKRLVTLPAELDERKLPCVRLASRAAVRSWVATMLSAQGAGSGHTGGSSP